MVVVQVQGRSKPGGEEPLERALRDVVAEARRVEGCLRYDWFRSPEAAGEVFVYAEFDSEDSFAAYRRGPVVRMIGERLLPLLESRPAFKHLRATVMEQG